MPASVADVLAAVRSFAPFDCAEEWDNVGLLAGRPDWPATRGLVAIDLTDAVAREALEASADLLVTYHPPIFKGIRAVTPDCGGPTTLLPDLLAARVTIISVHTALDAAPGGTNDLLLDAFDLAERRPLEPLVRAEQQYKLVVFVPAADVERLRQALAAAGAGVIGHYSECSFELAGRGTFRGDETTHPAVGQAQVLQHADEIRLELVLPRAALAPIVQALYATHPYEEPAFDLYPLHAPVARGAAGMGRVGLLRTPQPGPALLRKLGQRYDLSTALVVGPLEREFRAVVAAAGAFGVRRFRDPAALVLTGEFKHHDALDLQRRGITAVHLGHYASERPVLDLLATRLENALPGLRLTPARTDRNPFAPVRG
jgi:dinuclear metal center YbgI/SA1388 family protein